MEARSCEEQLGFRSGSNATTLTILKDTPELTSWRIDIVEAKGESMSFSWADH